MLDVEYTLPFRTYEEAINSKDKERWILAIDNELNSHQINGTWIVVDNHVADETTLTDKLMQIAGVPGRRIPCHDQVLSGSAREAVHANIVVPAAEVQRKLKEEERAKNMKVPDADERAKMSNPDTTTGLVPTSQASVNEYDHPGKRGRPTKHKHKHKQEGGHF